MEADPTPQKAWFGGGGGHGCVKHDTQLQMGTSGVMEKGMGPWETKVEMLSLPS